MENSWLSYNDDDDNDDDNDGGNDDNEYEDRVNVPEELLTNNLPIYQGYSHSNLTASST